MLIEQRKTMTVFKVKLLARRAKSDFNLIACGASRGGTSSLGILMSHFGFNMGENTHPLTYEDLDFVSLVDNRRVREVPKLIKERNETDPRWSLKLPQALINIETFDRHCLKPVFIIVIRNPFSVARSLVRHDKRFNNNLHSYQKGVQHAFHFYNRLKLLDKLNAPYVICEYETVRDNPKDFIDDFVEVFNVQATPNLKDQALKLISGSGYRDLSTIV